jgi:hypothetical protein
VTCSSVGSSKNLKKQKAKNNRQFKENWNQNKKEKKNELL